MRRWVFGVLLVACSAPLCSAGATATGSPQVSIGMPFAGKWAYNAAVNPPYTDGNSSHPSVHWTPGGGDWATDLYAPAGTPVRLHVSSSAGAVSISLRNTWDSCGADKAGHGIALKLSVAGTPIGWISYAHLDSVKSTGPYKNGAVLGKITSEPFAPGCFTARHTHFELKNTLGKTFACWSDHGNPGTTLAEGTEIGILGSTRPRPRQACPSLNLTQYAGMIVQWKGDKKAQKTAWLVGKDLKRRWIPDSTTYNCLKAKGIRGPIALPASVLDQLPDQKGVRAACAPPVGPTPSGTKIFLGLAPGQDGRVVIAGIAFPIDPTGDVVFPNTDASLGIGLECFQNPDGIWSDVSRTGGLFLVLRGPCQPGSPLYEVGVGAPGWYHVPVASKPERVDTTLGSVVLGQPWSTAPQALRDAMPLDKTDTEIVNGSPEELDEYRMAWSCNPTHSDLGIWVNNATGAIRFVVAMIHNQTNINCGGPTG